MQLKIHDYGLVVLIGPSGSGKTTFAKCHFRPSEVLSSDHYRSVVGDGERNATTTKDAFDVIETIAAKRLLIYGPEYTAPDQLERLRRRNTGRKTTLALREFALGIEALEQFVARAPLRNVHRAVFGILALEAEPTDPRL